jgi:hypothetical protein
VELADSGIPHEIFIIGRIESTGLVQVLVGRRCKRTMIVLLGVVSI